MGECCQPQHGGGSNTCPSSKVRQGTKCDASRLALMWAENAAAVMARQHKEALLSPWQSALEQ